MLIFLLLLGTVLHCTSWNGLSSRELIRINFLESSPLEERGGSENEGVADLSLNYEKNLNSFLKNLSSSLKLFANLLK